MTRWSTVLVGVGTIGVAALVGCGSDDRTGTIEPDGGSGGTAAASGAGGDAASPSGGSGGTAATGGGGLGGAAGTAWAGGTGGTGGEAYRPCAQLLALDDCGWQSVRAEFRPVQILVVMDKSASMRESMGEGIANSRWDAVRGAVIRAMRPLEPFISVGLDVFPAVENLVRDDPFATPEEWCAMPEADGTVIVPIGPGTETLDEMNRRLNENVAGTDFPEIIPGGATPMADALRRARAYFETATPIEMDAGNMYVLLATDGGPNCNGSLSCDADTCVSNLEGNCDRPSGASCCDTQPYSCLDYEAVLEQIGELQNLGVNTIVVGIPGSEPFAEYLDRFAEAGGQPDPDGQRSYYEVLAGATEDSLAQILSDITIDLIHDCTILLQEVPQNIGLVNVAVECEVVTQDMDDDNSGWRYDNPDAPTAILLEGDICQRIIEEGVRQVDVVYGCTTLH